MTESIYSGIAVHGEDAFDFLQAQLTNDLRLAGDADILLCGWCNPKGRVICLIRVRQEDGGYSLTLPSELASMVVKRLTMFRFRSRVEFLARDADRQATGNAASMDAWLLENLRAGIPEVWADQSERYTPHMLNLDLLGAVSLDKGCYPGQEIIARTHYRGASKRRLLRFEATAPVAAGARVIGGGREVGDVVNAIGTDLLAVVPLDAPLSELMVEDTAVRNVPLPYL